MVQKYNKSYYRTIKARKVNSFHIKKQQHIYLYIRNSEKINDIVN